ncbi:MAG TPA: hypothetical protein VH350_02785 [Candidatus Sulfotelmatobacter sp.]|jgi:hypothetical protein|nr:hypothetical protein [Candidatus Sulfotelmatobacter sp.]
MNHFRSLAIGMTLTVSLTLAATHAAGARIHGAEQGQSQNGAPDTMPSVDQHLKMLTERLDLTAQQQVKIRPILQRMLEGWQNVMRDTTLSEQVRHDKMKSVRDKADKQTRPILNTDQKNKLDELEQEPDPDQHGNGDGTARPPQ